MYMILYSMPSIIPHKIYISYSIPAQVKRDSGGQGGGHQAGDAGYHYGDPNSDAGVAQAQQQGRCAILMVQGTNSCIMLQTLWGLIAVPFMQVWIIAAAAI